MSNVVLPTVGLPGEVRDEIIRHAQEGKPEEVCGILWGKDWIVTRLVRGKNVAEERFENYEVDPETLLLQFDFEEQGEEMMGIYHSHPESEAYPSATDTWNAHYPKSLYFICSLENEDAPVLRAFCLTPHSVELDWIALTTERRFYETRPGLFALYLSEDDYGVDALANLPTSAGRPLYVVFSEEDGSPEQGDGRVVTVEELPIEIVS